MFPFPQNHAVIRLHKTASLSSTYVPQAARTGTAIKSYQTPSSPMFSPLPRYKAAALSTQLSPTLFHCLHHNQPAINPPRCPNSNLQSFPTQLPPQSPPPLHLLLPIPAATTILGLLPLPRLHIPTMLRRLVYMSCTR